MRPVNTHIRHFTALKSDSRRSRNRVFTAAQFRSQAPSPTRPDLRWSAVRRAQLRPDSPNTSFVVFLPPTSCWLTRGATPDLSCCSLIPKIFRCLHSPTRPPIYMHVEWSVGRSVDTSRPTVWCSPMKCRVGPRPIRRPTHQLVRRLSSPKGRPLVV